MGEGKRKLVRWICHRFQKRKRKRRNVERANDLPHAGFGGERNSTKMIFNVLTQFEELFTTAGVWGGGRGAYRNCGNVTADVLSVRNLLNLADKETVHVEHVGVVSVWDKRWRGFRATLGLSWNTQ